MSIRFDHRFIRPALFVVAAAIASTPSCSGREPVESPSDERVGVSEAASSAALPDIPAIGRDVAMIHGSSTTTPGQYSHPFIPPLRTSADGRVAVSIKQINGQVAFYLFAPEKLSGPFAVSAPGIDILASTTPMELSPTQLMGAGSAQLRHTAICDATPQFPVPGNKTNPYACGATLASDCYDLTVVASAELAAGGVQLWGTPITVRVDSPKTTSATLANITVGTPVGGQPLLVSTFLEQMVSNDGHLLIGRIGGSNLTWTNLDLPPGNQQVTTQGVDIVYAAGSAGANPCDVTQWTHLAPISHAPYDPLVNTTYGFAQAPFRDPEGNPIPDGVELQGSYPWIDRAGRNLFFYTSTTTLFYAETSGGAITTRYPSPNPSACVTACAPGDCCPSPTTEVTPPDNIAAYDEVSSTRGLALVGRWTHGKMVVLDGLLNNIDYGLPHDDDVQRLVTLYTQGTGPSSWSDQSGNVQLGTGRDDTSAASWPPGSPTNSTFVDSLENLFNWEPNIAPLTPRDVVWTVNNGRGSDEIAFDDFLDPNGFIVSEMTGSVTWANNNPLLNARGMVVQGHPKGMDGHFTSFDGFVRPSLTSGSGFDPTGTIFPIHVQNAATAVATQWNIPSYGLVQGNARIEPAALGGIRGKGLWLDGTGSISYAIPASQPQSLTSTPWFFGIFLDSRFADDTTLRRLFTFPDNSSVWVLGRHSVVYHDASGATVATIALPVGEQLAYQGFSHLGLVVDATHAKVYLYLDGFLYSTLVTSPSALLFQMVAGKSLIVGASVGGADGVRGWVDDFKAMAEAPNVEVICNHARGTLAGVSSGALSAQAARYPAFAHTSITTKLNASGQTTYPAYACWHDYTQDLGAYVGNIPPGATSIRRNLNFPEGPLQYDEPRPDSSTNPFCKSCHVAGQVSQLSPSALTQDLSTTEGNDTRRQPLQPPRLVFGNVPPSYVSSGVPATAAPEPLPPLGTPMDPWVYPVHP